MVRQHTAVADVPQWCQHLGQGCSEVTDEHDIPDRAGGSMQQADEEAVAGRLVGGMAVSRLPSFEKMDI